jgi:SsrA-binding protein
MAGPQKRGYDCVAEGEAVLRPYGGQTMTHVLRLSNFRCVKMNLMAEEVKVFATNRKAGFEYFLLERFEAGLALKGSEIKSIRAGQMSLKEAYVDVENGNEAWLMEAHIAPYEQANRFNHEPTRKRRLLLHKKQIRELWNAVRQKGMTIVPTQVYLKNGRAKIEIALARGKKAYDKRATIAKRDQAREQERETRVR